MRPSSVVVSAVVHAIALAGLIVAPLVASFELPAVHVPSVPYVRVQAPGLPTAPSSAAPREPGRRAPDPRGAPLAPPDGIAPEPAVPPRDAAGVDGGLEPVSETGVPAGIGTADAIDVPAPPLPKPPAPVRVGGAVRPPQRIAYVAPQYPPLAQATRVEGEVQIEAIIGTDGTVRQLRVLRGAALLDAAALDAVRQWRYTPTLLNGIPVPVVMTVTVSFRLR